VDLKLILLEDIAFITYLLSTICDGLRVIEAAFYVSFNVFLCY